MTIKSTQPIEKTSAHVTYDEETKFKMMYSAAGIVAEAYHNIREYHHSLSQSLLDGDKKKLGELKMKMDEIILMLNYDRGYF